MTSAGVRRRAVIDLDALSVNLADASGSFVDVRADAYGHGLSAVAAVARDLDVAGLVVSDENAASVAIAAGFDRAALRIGRHTEPTERDVVMTDIYGLAADAASAPVLTLLAEVIATKHVGADAGVSYGYTYRTSSPTTLALVGLGYADGLPRLASNRAEVRIAGVRRPLVGRVAMDQFVVDCGDVRPEVGADVVVFGDPAAGAPSAQEWATATERDPLELTAGLGSRIRRVPRSAS